MAVNASIHSTDDHFDRMTYAFSAAATKEVVYGKVTPRIDNEALQSPEWRYRDGHRHRDEQKKKKGTTTHPSRRTWSRWRTWTWIV